MIPFVQLLKFTVLLFIAWNVWQEIHNDPLVIALPQSTNETANCIPISNQQFIPGEYIPPITNPYLDYLFVSKRGARSGQDNLRPYSTPSIPIGNTSAYNEYFIYNDVGNGLPIYEKQNDDILFVTEPQLDGWIHWMDGWTMYSSILITCCSILYWLMIHPFTISCRTQYRWTQIHDGRRFPFRVVWIHNVPILTWTWHRAIFSRDESVILYGNISAFSLRIWTPSEDDWNVFLDHSHVDTPTIKERLSKHTREINKIKRELRECKNAIREMQTTVASIANDYPTLNQLTRFVSILDEFEDRLAKKLS